MKTSSNFLSTILLSGRWRFTGWQTVGERWWQGEHRGCNVIENDCYCCTYYIYRYTYSYWMFDIRIYNETFTMLFDVPWLLIRECLLINICI